MAAIHKSLDLASGLDCGSACALVANVSRMNIIPLSVEALFND